MRQAISEKKAEFASLVEQVEQASKDRLSRLEEEKRSEAFSRLEEDARTRAEIEANIESRKLQAEYGGRFLKEDISFGYQLGDGNSTTERQRDTNHSSNRGESAASDLVPGSPAARITGSDLASAHSAFEGMDSDDDGGQDTEQEAEHLSSHDQTHEKGEHEREQEDSGEANEFDDEISDDEF